MTTLVLKWYLNISFLKIILDLKLKKMEVHHHTHHPKKWKEYITEFVMLFAAVTLGFFAENLREHTIVNEKIEKNKIAILKDLKQDAITIDSIFKNEDLLINEFNKTIYILALYKQNKISDSQLLDSIRSLPFLVAGTSTLYMNNSSFKNMQSSGLLSNLDNVQLKTQLSYYYEVVFKRMESNNNFFDQAGINFNNAYLVGLGKLIREDEIIDKNYPTNNPIEYTKYMFDLKKTKDLLKSDEFVYDVQRYYNYIFVYRLALTKAREENNKLIQLMEHE